MTIYQISCCKKFLCILFLLIHTCFLIMYLIIKSKYCFDWCYIVYVGLTLRLISGIVIIGYIWIFTCNVIWILFSSQHNPILVFGHRTSSCCTLSNETSRKTAIQKMNHKIVVTLETVNRTETKYMQFNVSNVLTITSPIYLYINRIFLYNNSYHLV